MLPRGFFLRIVEDLSLRSSVAAWLLGCGILNRVARAAPSCSARTGLYLGSALFTIYWVSLSQRYRRTQPSRFLTSVLRFRVLLTCAVPSFSLSIF
jgi:hypothetical protein